MGFWKRNNEVSISDGAPGRKVITVNAPVVGHCYGCGSDYSGGAVSVSWVEGESKPYVTETIVCFKSDCRASLTLIAQV
jgi:hypothetical protein